MKKFIYLLLIFLPLHLVAQDYYFHVKLKSPNDIDLLKAYCEERDAMIICQHNELPLWYKLSVTNESEMNAQEMAEETLDCGLFQNACLQIPDAYQDNSEKEVSVSWLNTLLQIEIPLITTNYVRQLIIPVSNTVPEMGQIKPFVEKEIISYEIYHFLSTSLVGYGRFSNCGYIIDASYLPRGIYLIRIFKSDGSFDVQKVAL